MNINVDYLKRCIQTLESAYQQLEKIQKDDIHADYTLKLLPTFISDATKLANNIADGNDE